LLSQQKLASQVPARSGAFPSNQSINRNNIITIPKVPTNPKETLQARDKRPAEYWANTYYHVEVSLYKLIFILRQDQVRNNHLYHRIRNFHCKEKLIQERGQVIRTQDLIFSIFRWKVPLSYLN
jgi:hypothetical protein